MNQNDKKCCFCSNHFDPANLPRMMPFCEHNGCTNCLKQIIAKQPLTISCIHCHQKESLDQADLEYFPKNIAMIKQIKDQSLQTHSNEIEMDKSGLQKNLISEKIEVKQLCNIHKKQLQIICVTDRIKICPHCAIFGLHKDHKFKTTSQFLEQIASKDSQFQHFRQRKTALDNKINSAEFKSSIVKKIGDQKDRLVTQIKTKFGQLYDHIRLAQKKAFDDVIKNFKAVYQKITALIKEQNDAQRKYKEWEIKCQDLFEKANKCTTVEKKVSYYFGGPLEICSQGQNHLKRIQNKIDGNISTIEQLISKIKIVEKQSLSNEVFNYINIFVEDFEELDLTMHVPQQVFSPKDDQKDSKKPIKVEFSTENIFEVKKDPYTPQRKSKSKDKYHGRLSDKKSPIKQKEKINQDQERNNNMQKMISDFCQRQNTDSLDLTAYSLNDGEICDILKHLMKFKRIKGLKLGKNKLTNEGLVRAVDFMPGVTNLNLAFNQLTDDALLNLLAQRQKVPNLRIINLSNNRINERKAKTAIDELKRMGIIVTI